MVLGLLFGKVIKQHLFTPLVVAVTFILGAFVILWAERRQQAARIHRVEDMTPWDALKVGLVQCFAMIPGTSRSGATIIGGMLCGLERKVATEFSFLPGHPHADWRWHLQPVQGACRAEHGCCPGVSGRAVDGIRQRLAVRALAAALHFQQ